MALGAVAVRGTLVERRALGASTRAAMLDLMDRHFLGVTRAIFEDDLSGKDHAVLLTDATGGLRGFSTLAVARARHGDESLRVVYSGDTVVDTSARNGPALASAWIDAVRVLCPPGEGSRVMWLLICSSVRTWRFLPVFFREFHPRPGAEAPEPERELLCDLAAQRYGAAFDAGAGLVRLAHPQPVRPGVQACDGGEDAAWFAARNPGHARGDELVCLCDLGDANLTAAGRRMVRAGERSRALPAGGSAA